MNKYELALCCLLLSGCGRTGLIRIKTCDKWIEGRDTSCIQSLKDLDKKWMELTCEVIMSEKIECSRENKKKKSFIKMPQVCLPFIKPAIEAAAGVKK